MADSPIVPDFQAVTLNILVNSEAFAGIFDELEVWRSTGPGVPFMEITGPLWSAARIPHDGGDVPVVLVPGPQVNVINKRLSILVRSGDLTQLDFDFIGSSAAILKDVAIQITDQSLGRLHSYVDENAELVLETVAVGNSAYLQVLSTDAAIFLGLPTTLPDSEAFGKESRIKLRPGVTVYAFSDQAGSPTTSYKTRFRNTLSGLTSEFSIPFTGTQAIGVSSPNLVIGYLTLVDASGRPLPNIAISISSKFQGTTVEGKVVAGADLVDSTNSDGYVEFVLIRGQSYTMGIAGTNIVKDIVAPTDASIMSFLLTDPAYGNGDNDYFLVRVPDLPTLERRSI